MTPYVIAHRGSNKVAPQNTLPAFRQAVAEGTDGFETDVHVTRDGKLVICHNYTIDATSDGRGAISDYTLGELRLFDFGSYFSPDFKNTVVFILGDHDTPVDSVDYMVPQPLGLSASQIFIGIFSADTALFNGLTVREDVASQLDLGPTIFDLAQVREPNHFWGYDLLVHDRPAEQPSIFFSQNAYYLGFRDHVLAGGLENEDVYRTSAGGEFPYAITTDAGDLAWKERAVGAARAVRSVLRNDIMMPQH